MAQDAEGPPAGTAEAYDPAGWQRQEALVSGEKRTENAGKTETNPPGRTEVRKKGTLPPAHAAGRRRAGPPGSRQFQIEFGTPNGKRRKRLLPPLCAATSRRRHAGRRGRGHRQGPVPAPECAAQLSPQGLCGCCRMPVTRANSLNSCSGSTGLGVWPFIPVARQRAMSSS